MKPMSGVYVIQNKINGDCYFGQSVRVSHRLECHIDCLVHGHHDNSRLLRAVNKYGIDNFIFAPIIYCEKCDLTYYEQKCVDIFQSTYNICKECVNSRKGAKHSEETRNRLSIAWQKRRLVPFSDETRKKIADGHKGVKLSAEVRQKIREALTGNANSKGRKLSTGHKAKIGAAGRGKKASPETLVRLRESHFGHVMPDAQKERLRVYMLGNKRAATGKQSAEVIARRMEGKRKAALRRLVDIADAAQ